MKIPSIAVVLVRPNGVSTRIDISGEHCTGLMLDEAERLVYAMTTGERFPFPVEQPKPKAKAKAKR